MKCFEYITLNVDSGDLSELCSYGAIGWEIAANKSTQLGFKLILKREVEGDDAIRVLNYHYSKAKGGKENEV